jgi:hypothetical protein
MQSTTDGMSAVVIGLISTPICEPFSMAKIVEVEEQCRGTQKENEWPSIGK